MGEQKRRNAHMNSSFYDKDYYINGIATGKSNYDHYRWIPELTIPLAMTMIDHLEIKPHHEILDYGCALGFLVKAFRLLHRKAYGVDISEYAIDNADSSVKDYCYHLHQLFHVQRRYSICIVKDVFEHMTVTDISLTIIEIINAERIFVVVPLGKNKKYVAPANSMDKSHIICEDLDWWAKKFLKLGLQIEEKSYQVVGIKDAYYAEFPKSHGFFILRKSW
jgi:2-polyprenyl-3-methyl-5-hydroxy-6-metoxy-1,4-benzoquinol methylase